MIWVLANFLQVRNWLLLRKWRRGSYIIQILYLISAISLFFSFPAIGITMYVIYCVGFGLCALVHIVNYHGSI
jgi:hypothetical protein